MACDPASLLERGGMLRELLKGRKRHHATPWAAGALSLFVASVLGALREASFSKRPLPTRRRPLKTANHRYRFGL
jgi:hypothetical protein